MVVLCIFFSVITFIISTHVIISYKEVNICIYILNVVLFHFVQLFLMYYSHFMLCDKYLFLNYLFVLIYY